MLGNARILFLVGTVLVGLSTATLTTWQTTAETRDDPATFLTDLSARAIDQLTDTSIPRAERERRFKALLHEGFDMPLIARFVLGKFRRSAPKEDRKAFFLVFEELLVQRFLPYFESYQGEAFDVEKVFPDPVNPRLIAVISQLYRNDGQALQISWRLRRKDGGFKIVDVVAEGVSLALTFRSEYAAILKRNNGDVAALTAMLREKVDRGDYVPQNLVSPSAESQSP